MEEACSLLATVSATLSFPSHVHSNLIMVSQKLSRDITDKTVPSSATSSQDTRTGISVSDYAASFIVTSKIGHPEFHSPLVLEACQLLVKEFIRGVQVGDVSFPLQATACVEGDCTSALQAWLIGYTRLDLEQTFLPDAIPLYEDTWPAIEHLIFEPVRMNVANHSVILCSGLQPKSRNIQLLCSLEQTERHLSSGS